MRNLAASAGVANMTGELLLKRHGACGHRDIDLHVGYLLKDVAGRHLAWTQSPVPDTLPLLCLASCRADAVRAPSPVPVMPHFQPGRLRMSWSGSISFESTSVSL